MVTKRLKENYLVRFAFEIPAYSAQHYFNGSSGLRPNIIAAAIGKDIALT
jgi:hypothetical protein